MANIFKLTDDMLAGYTYHEGVKTLETNDLYKLFPIESCDTYINSKDFVEPNLTDDIETFSCLEENTTINVNCKNKIRPQTH